MKSWPRDAVPLSTRLQRTNEVPISECPLCGQEWEPDSDCDHEAGWYKEWIIALVKMIETDG